MTILQFVVLYVEVLYILYHVHTVYQEYSLQYIAIKSNRSSCTNFAQVDYSYAWEVVEVVVQVLGGDVNHE